MKILSVIAISLMLGACASTKVVKPPPSDNQSTIFEISRSLVYDTLKEFRSCYAKTEAAEQNYIILFRSEAYIGDDSAVVKSFDLTTVHPAVTDVGVCFENAKKIGMDRFQREWVQAKAALKLGKHLIIASGEVSPKGRYNTTDLDTGVTEVGY